MEMKKIVTIRLGNTEYDVTKSVQEDLVVLKEKVDNLELFKYPNATLSLMENIKNKNTQMI